MAKVNIPKFKLNNGMEIPALGYGTWLGMNDKFEVKMEDLTKLVDAMSYAIDVGYRHVDTAHLYRVEPEVGLVVRRKITEGVVKREDVFITTKVWQHNHREADVEASVRASLRRMGLDYFDLVLMHWPMSISVEGVDEKIDYLDTWRGFETVLQKGLVKSIGVSNFNLSQMKRLLAHCKVVPVVNQVEINLNLGQEDLVSYCKANNVQVVGFTTFGSMVGRAAPATLQPKMDNPTMLALGKKYNKTVTQIALRYLYQRGVATIPKSISKERVLENASVFDFELDNNEMATLAKFDVGYRTEKAPFWQHYENYPFEDPGVATFEIPLSLRKWKDCDNYEFE
ncbi:aldo-keto reductase AKR2E4-like [Epargyreus clarus]|uniref:aldo-keto reductase AKR2E4-like n=1 Tax=Epargyreus clarus TaxID=520877 RepID=UPI003C2FC7E0